METLPECCLPIARCLTTTEQMGQRVQNLEQQNSQRVQNIDQQSSQWRDEENEGDQPKDQLQESSH